MVTTSEICDTNSCDIDFVALNHVTTSTSILVSQHGNDIENLWHKKLGHRFCGTETWYDIDNTWPLKHDGRHRENVTWFLYPTKAVKFDHRNNMLPNIKNLMFQKGMWYPGTTLILVVKTYTFTICTYWSGMLVGPKVTHGFVTDSHFNTLPYKQAG